VQQRFDSTLIVDSQGAAHLEGHIRISPGRHRVVVLVDDTATPAVEVNESWEDFIKRTSGSLTGIGFKRPPQGKYERREEIV
jgi:hypothetical protein